MVGGRLVRLAGHLREWALGRCVARGGSDGELGWSEFAHGRRAWVGGLEPGHGQALVADEQVAVEELADLDAAMGVGRATAARSDRETMAVEGDGVVLGDDAFVLEAEDGIG